MIVEYPRNRPCRGTWIAASLLVVAVASAAGIGAVLSVCVTRAASALETPPQVASVSAWALDAHRIQVAWQSVGLAGVRYELHRGSRPDFAPDDTTLHAVLDGTSFADVDLPEGKTYCYRVIARASDGALASPSVCAVATTLPDRAAPLVVGLAAPGPDRIEVVFDEPLGLSAAELAAATRIEGVAVLDAAWLDESGRRARLLTSPQPTGAVLTATLDLRDRALRPNLARRSVRFVGGAGLTGWWPLTDGSGELAQERTGRTGAGRLLGGARWLEPGAVTGESMLHLSGTDQRVALAGFEATGAGSGLTLSIWFRADDFATPDGRLMSCATGIAEQEHVWMLSTFHDGVATRLRGRVRAGGTTHTLIAPGAALQAGIWMHAALVHDGHELRLYLDGQSIGRVAAPGAPAAPLGTPAALGNQPVAAGARQFHGRLRDARVLTRALSDAEIALLATRPMTVAPVHELVVLQGATAEAMLRRVDALLADDVGVPGATLPGPIPADLVLELADAPRLGTATLLEDGRVRYRQDGRAGHTDAFTFQVADTLGRCGPPTRVEVRIDADLLHTQGLVLRLESDQGVQLSGDRVVRWQDRSGRGNDLLPKGAPYYLPQALGGRGVVALDGALDRLTRDAGVAGMPTGNGNRTIILAMNHRAPGLGAFSMGGSTCGQRIEAGRLADGRLAWGRGCGPEAGAAAPKSGWVLHTLILNAGQLEQFAGETLLSTTPISLTVPAMDLRLGGGLAAGAVACDVAAVLIYDHALSPGTHHQVLDYLNARFLAAVEPAPRAFRRIARGGTAWIDALGGSGDGVSVESVRIESAPLHGTLALEPDTGMLRYTHDGSAAPADSFRYFVQDARGARGPSCPVHVAIDAPQCPVTTAGLVLHLDAACGVELDDAGHVVRWQDASPWMNDVLAQGAVSVTTAPAAVMLQGAAFLERTDALHGFPSGAAPRTLVVVGSFDVGYGFVGYGADGCGHTYGVGFDEVLGLWTGQLGCAAGDLDGDLIAIDAPLDRAGLHVLSIVAEDGLLTLRIDGLTVAAANRALSTTGEHLRLGLIDTNDPDAAAGDAPGAALALHEVLLFDRALGVAELTDLESALGARHRGADCQPCEAPVVTLLPVPTGLCAGGAVTLETLVTGTGPLRMQWRLDGVPIEGATGAQHVFVAASEAGSGTVDVVVSNSCGTVISEAWSWTVQPTTTILAPPLGATRCAGETLELAVLAQGAEPLTVTWQRDGVTIDGAHGDRLLLPALAPDHAGSYRAIVSGPCGEATSASVPVIVEAPVRLVVRPSDQTVCSGESVRLTGAATGSGLLEFQWFHDDEALAGETGAELLLDAVQIARSGRYRVEVRGACGSLDHAEAQLVVEGPPRVLVEPAPHAACLGDPVLIEVLAEGAGPLSYHWERDGQPVVPSPGQRLLLTAAHEDLAGAYRVRITDRCGRSVDSAIAVLEVHAGARVLEFPPDREMCEGARVTFEPHVVGEDPISYQWQRSGMSLPGATARILTIPSASLEDVGVYRVLITNRCGTIASPEASLGVRPPVHFTAQPVPQILCAGSPLTLHASAHGGAAVEYQWRRNGVAIENATQSTLHIPVARETDGGLYDVLATGHCGTVASLAVPVQVDEVPRVVAQSGAVTTCAGFAVVLQVVSSPHAGLSCQWRRDGVMLPGESAMTLSIAIAAPEHAGRYEAVLSNDCGLVTTLEMPLAVLPVEMCDCNGNGQVDGDEIAAGLAVDCNGNGIPDACDLASGVLVDLDVDGIPDACLERFVRGDANGDGGIDLADAITILRYLFAQGVTSLPCEDAADVTDNGALDLADPIGLLFLLFRPGTPPLAAPYPDCGFDRTQHDRLRCTTPQCP